MRERRSAHFASSRVSEGILVVVDVKLAIGISFTSSVERNSDKVLSEDSREYGIPKRTVLVEDFVQNILRYVELGTNIHQWSGNVPHPVVDLSLVAAHNLCDMLLDDLREFSWVIDVIYPASELRMPHCKIRCQIISLLMRKSFKGMTSKCYLGCALE